jgi:hypothetical protein
MKSCRQKSGESLRDYIRRFSQKCHELLRVVDANIISAFWSSTTCWTLVHELGHDQSNTNKELLDIATQHTYGNEVVGDIFVLGDGKTTLDSSIQSHRQRHYERR